MENLTRQIDDLFGKLCDRIKSVVKTHQGAYGYIDMQPDPIRNNDAVFVYLYDDYTDDIFEVLVYGIRVHDGRLQIAGVPNKTFRFDDPTWGDEDFNNAIWNNVTPYDLLLYKQSLYNIARSLGQYTETGKVSGKDNS